MKRKRKDPTNQSNIISKKSDLTWPSVAQLPPDPRIELMRLNAIGNLRKSFDAMCRKFTEKSTRFSFERWLYRSLALACCNSSVSNNEISDPVVPSWKWFDQGLVTDLIRMVDMDETLAIDIAKNLADEAALFSNQISNTIYESPCENILTLTYKDDMINFGFTCDRQIPKISITKMHFDKLVRMFSKRYSLNGKEEEISNSKLFHKLVFCLLIRYRALGGDGYQAAIPQECFNVLQQLLEVDHECFASPLNVSPNNEHSFFSAFKDIDSHFGSRGSFFDPLNNITTGSYELNPPFAAELVYASALKVESLLSASQEPLSFVVIVPAWDETSGCIQFSNSIFLRAHWRLEAKKHTFIDGAVYKKSVLQRLAPFDSSIFILQNDQGSVRWPVTREIELKFKSSFRLKKL